MLPPPSWQVIAFAHEIQKGSVLRGQWFYADDEAARSYVWFHATRELVQRAIATDGVEVVDLGPSGSDSFSALKSKYGFASVVEWPSVANYRGPFWYGVGKRRIGGVLGSLRNREFDSWQLKLLAAYLVVVGTLLFQQLGVR